MMKDGIKYKKAKVLRDGKVVKEGVIVERTTYGARIYNPKDVGDHIEFAEWFPWTSRAGITVEEAK